MKLGRFVGRTGGEPAGVGWHREDGALVDLRPAGVTSLTDLLETEDLAGRLAALQRGDWPRLEASAVRWRCPLEGQEVWAAGVTYRRSKEARMGESAFGATAYDRVYEAERPELFFKGLATKVVGPGEAIGIRSDARWSVPEPELALVLNSRGRCVGLTIGNDVTARDVEGENLLYLPQAKIYEGSCAVGPWVRVGVQEAEARSWTIGVEVRRGGEVVWAGATEVGRLKRSFEELAAWLFRCQQFPAGVVLLTGTGVVPPDAFALAEGDGVRVEVSGLGVLANGVRRV